jgi:hypothetical protein
MNTRELLEQLRDRGWSDIKIAEALGVNPVTIYRWRLGRVSPKTELGVELALRRLLRRVGPPPRRRRRNSLAPANA